MYKTDTLMHALVLMWIPVKCNEIKYYYRVSIDVIQYQYVQRTHSFCIDIDSNGKIAVFTTVPRNYTFRKLFAASFIHMASDFCTFSRCAFGWF